MYDEEPQLDGCIVWNAHNTVIVSKHSAICVQAVYFLHSTRPSVTWLNCRCYLVACDWMSALSGVLLIFSFQFRPTFLPRWSASQPASTAACLVYAISDVAENLEIFSCTECTGQWNDLKLILTVKKWKLDIP